MLLCCAWIVTRLRCYDIILKLVARVFFGYSVYPLLDRFNGSANKIKLK